jgi:hypothetical protein
MKALPSTVLIAISPNPNWLTVGIEPDINMVLI